MLRRLRIQNVLLIENADLEFGPGMTVISGETGAGKSILLAALGLVLGERATGDLIGPWGTDAVVEAAFELPPDSPIHGEVMRLLDEAGLATGDNLVVIRRILSGNRSRAFINNGAALQKLVVDVAAHLVDLHGQHEHQSLLYPETYPSLIDHGLKPDIIKAYNEAYNSWHDLIGRLGNLERDERERRRQEDLLSYQINEIDAAELEPGEDERVEQRLKTVRHAETIRSALCELEQRVHGDGDQPGILDELVRLERRLSDAAKYNENLASLLENWTSALTQLEDVARDLQACSDSIDDQPEQLQILEERHFLIQSLKRKYGSTLEEMLAFRDRQARELEEITNRERSTEALRKERPIREKQLLECSQALHDARARAAKKIAKEVESYLHQLGMERARFEIDVAYREDQDGLPLGNGLSIRPGPKGPDRIAFRLSTIPDRPPADLKDVASGGEISRIMLALKSVLGRADGVPTMVFDEIDTGIGGRISEVVADRLAALAQGEQIICITHLPQIAVRADANLAVRKEDREGKLVTFIESLTGKQREKEILRMLGGPEGSKSSQKYVREMLEKAGK